MHLVWRLVQNACITTMSAIQNTLAALCAYDSCYAGLSNADLLPMPGNAFQLRRVHACFLKWIDQADEIGLREVRVNQAVLPHYPGFAPRLLFIAPHAQGCVAAWEWLEGQDLRAGAARKQHLPQAFERLGSFHAVQQAQPFVESPTNGASYASIPSLLEGEIALLGTSYPIPNLAHLLHPLQQGYATFTHGDMHPGNLRLTPSGVQLIDWGYARPGLNLFDLDYIQSVGLPDDDADEWWKIGPAEAPNVLAAYSRSSGLEVTPALHQAVMLWAELRSHLNAMQAGDEAATARSHQRLQALLHLMSPTPAAEN